MGANAQTSVPTFTAGEVLTAANMNISARTGVPVFSNTTTRDAGFGGTGEKTLAEGQLCYLEDSNVVQYYDGAAWATVGPASAGALTLISTTTIGTAVSSVEVTSAFSSTYDNYLITISGGTASANSAGNIKFGSTTTGYYWQFIYNLFSNGTPTASNGANDPSIPYVFGHTSNTLSGWIEVQSPNLAKYTTVNARPVYAATSGGYSGAAGGTLADTTAYTAFTLTPASGTLTGGTIRVYGYAK